MYHVKVMDSSEEMLEGIFAKARLITPGKSQVVAKAKDDIVNLETVWSKVGLGSVEPRGLVDQDKWYNGTPEMLSAEFPFPSKKDSEKDGGSSINDAITYEKNRLESVNQMLGGRRH